MLDNQQCESAFGRKYTMKSKKVAIGGDGKEYEIIRETKNIEHLKQLCTMIDVSEFIRKPIDYIEADGTYFVYRKQIGGMITLTEYIDGAENFDDVRFSVVCDAAINLIDNFQILHYYNLAYSSVSPNDILISLKTGQIVFIGCERLCKVGSAPNIKRSQLYSLSSADAPVSVADDMYAMFSMLFRIFYLTRPTLSETAKRGEYIFENAASKGDDNFVSAFLYRRLYPEFISEMFDAFFTGISVGEVEAKETILRLKYSIVNCYDRECGAENFFTGSELRCWKCGKVISPVLLQMEHGSGNDIVLTNGCTISRNDVFHDGVFNQFVGMVVRNPKDKNVYGIKNMLPYAISFTKRDGKEIDLQPGQAAPIALGVTILFSDNVRGRIALAEFGNTLNGKTQRTAVACADGKTTVCERVFADEGIIVVGEECVEASAEAVAIEGEVQRERHAERPAGYLPSNVMELPKGGGVSIYRAAKFKNDESSAEVYDAE